MFISILIGTLTPSFRALIGSLYILLTWWSGVLLKYGGSGGSLCLGREGGERGVSICIHHSIGCDWGIPHIVWLAVKGRIMWTLWVENRAIIVCAKCWLCGWQHSLLCVCVCSYVTHTSVILLFKHWNDVGEVVVYMLATSVTTKTTDAPSHSLSSGLKHSVTFLDFRRSCYTSNHAQSQEIRSFCTVSLGEY